MPYNDVPVSEIQSAILAKVREVWERKVLDNIEPTHALVIGDRVWLTVAGVCSREEFMEIVNRMVAEGVLTVHETAKDTALKLHIEESCL